MGMPTRAGGGGGAVLLCAPSFAVSSPASSTVSALLRSSYVLKASSSFGSTPNFFRSGIFLSVRRGRRFQAARASKEDEADVNRDADPNEKAEDGTVDWDIAWSSFKKPQKRKYFLKLDMDQYVTRRPKHSNYQMSEEVDPLRKSERSVLGAWTSMKFTYALSVVIIGLVVYMVIIVGPPPHH